MKEHINNPLDGGWEPDDFVMDFGPDDGADADLWQNEPLPDDLDSSEYAPIGFDEPEPEGEFIGGLSQELHIPDGGIHNLRQTLELDEFLAYVGEMTDCQRYRIEETLLSFSAPRRANWLRWMKLKEWTGKSLLLFLQFYDLWNETPMWWEYLYFSTSSDAWELHYNSATLSREKCYNLALLRLGYRVDAIIDESWFEDWDDFGLWRHGFNSFASFAVFRAGVSPGEDWKRLVSDARNGRDDYELRNWLLYVKWWDDMSEWRDNLT